MARLLKIFFVLILISFFISCQSNKLNDKITILTIGDSNGFGPGKWPDQLAKMLGDKYNVVNNSQGGRTVGFDNLGRVELNTLKQIDTILTKASREVGAIGGFDKVLICLGTNDCKAVFDSVQVEVAPNLEKLIQSVRAFKFPNGQTPAITIISPPPYGKDGYASEKYRDGDKKVAALVPQFRELAEKLGCDFIDIHAPMLPVVEMLTKDGVHFKEDGYKMMAELITTQLQAEQ